MNLKLTLAKGCLALSLASMAAAESPTMRFACDTRAGHFLRHSHLWPREITVDVEFTDVRLSKVN